MASNFRKALRDRTRRELAIVDKKLTPDQIDEVSAEQGALSRAAAPTPSASHCPARRSWSRERRRPTTLSRPRSSTSLWTGYDGVVAALALGARQMIRVQTVAEIEERHEGILKVERQVLTLTAAPRLANGSHMLSIACAPLRPPDLTGPARPRVRPRSVQKCLSCSGISLCSWTCSRRRLMSSKTALPMPRYSLLPSASSVLARDKRRDACSRRTTPLRR